MGKLSDLELGWLSGLLEGEGCFRWHATGPTHTPSVQIEMVDEDVMLRASVIIQKITKRPHNINHRQSIGNRSHYQPSFRIQVSGESALRLMRKVVPLLGARRRQRAWQILNGHKAPQKKLDMPNVVALAARRVANG